MPSLEYLALRLARRFTPAPIVHWMMGHNIGVQSGLETRDAQAAVNRYLDALALWGLGVRGARVLILGYGGYFGSAVELLKRGAQHVVLLDPYALKKRHANLVLAKEAEPYIFIKNGEVSPNPASITLVHDTAEAYQNKCAEALDLVLSSSVYEHLENPRQVTKSLAALAKFSGAHVHFIDLRDHLFRYPFEMLCCSEKTWRRFLNPPSNLNRLRIWDYEAIFRDIFERCELEIIELALDAFRKTRSRISPTFLSGEENRDAAAKILVRAAGPK